MKLSARFKRSQNTGQDGVERSGDVGDNDIVIVRVFHRGSIWNELNIFEQLRSFLGGSYIFSAKKSSNSGPGAQKNRKVPRGVICWYGCHFVFPRQCLCLTLPVYKLDSVFYLSKMLVGAVFPFLFAPSICILPSIQSTIIHKPKVGYCWILVRWIRATYYTLSKPSIHI